MRLMGIEETQRQAAALADKAIEAAQTLPHPEMLVALAQFTVQRDV